MKFWRFALSGVPDFILMDGNVRLHAAHWVKEYLESEDIHRLDRAARSPDLNPIDHAWDALGNVFANRNLSLPPRTIPGLKTALN
ncbi:DDE_3 domain-containing protein [Trichonephila clavipes]|uniref:DDE_3 domain-containing protein n=1 Tax=Trichonephila clavipes TaxID=2585209 RepID=A0A8X6V025_TRICX|nr:DDE_3 domain-containing protein [Trichonephila clavipes]